MPDPVRDAIVAKLEGIAGIGVVHGYERFDIKEDRLAALYTPAGSSTVRGWHICRRSIRETSEALGSSTEDTLWEIVGYRQVFDDEASELLFDATVDAVRTAFRADEDLGGAVDTTTLPEGEMAMQLNESSPYLFSGVICHRVSLSLVTRRYLRG